MTASSHVSAGLAAHRAGRLAEAESAYRRVFAADPRDARTCHLLGLVLQQAGATDEAVSLLRRSIELAPTVPEYRNNFAGLLGSLGRHQDAVGVLEEALRLREDYPDALDNLGVALENLERFDEAVEVLERASALMPNLSRLHVHLSNSLRKMGRVEEALNAAQRGLERDKMYPEAHNVLGAALLEQNDVPRAFASFRRALNLRPDFADARVNLARTLLLAGDLEKGFAEFEWRLKLPKQKRELPGTCWTGSDPSGKTILVYADGGMGNTIQWVRYVPLLNRRGAKVVIECQAALRALLEKVKGVEQVVAPGEGLPPFDCYAAVTSLPHLFRTALANIPAETPYVEVDASLVERWCSVVNEVRGLKVGVCWKGSQEVVSMRGRSFPADSIQPLSELPGISLISLQHGDAPPEGCPVIVLPGLEPQSMRLEDVAAVMHHLDVVVTSDTSIAHLAGALGVPTWVALKRAACWRWMLDREDSPWYPSLRLFRQKTPGDWAGVFDSMARALRQLLREQEARFSGGSKLASVI